MNDKQLEWQSGGIDREQSFFRLISPEEYPQHGIDPQDVPMGTFAAEDHPGFLPSRFGGNAYGLGLVEQGVLTNADTEFLESVDFQDSQKIGLHAKKLNAIYQKLGLLIRFTSTGNRYFLIPINLVAHSLQEIKTKADEIEELILRHIWETRTDRLDIGLLTSRQDLIAHELTARLSSHRIVVFESLEKLCAWRLPLDVVILPKDLFEYLQDQEFHHLSKTPLNRQSLFQYGMYLAGKVYDLLETNGKLLMLAHSPVPQEDVTCHVRFKSEEDLKSFLLFSHIFKTKKTYEALSIDNNLEVYISDLHYYLGRFAFSEPHLRQLLGEQKPENLNLQQINMLLRLNLHMPQTYVKNPEKPWRWILEPYFTTNQLKRKSPKLHHHYWKDRLEIDRELPESLMVYVGLRRRPDIELSMLEEEVEASGMLGCSLSLVGEQFNSFRYVLDVLKILIRIRDNDFPKISELERARLMKPFLSLSKNFQAVLRLLGQTAKLERIRDMLNPDHIEGERTPILENIPKLSLHGFTPAQLREILLIVAGYSAMGRVVLGKFPAKALRPISHSGKAVDYQETLDLLRVCRLMSLAGIAAALGDTFTGEQTRELYRVYDAAVFVATDPKLDWDKFHDLRISALGGVQNKAIREMMKLFNLFYFLRDWQEFLGKGIFEREVVCDYEPQKLAQLEDTLQLAGIAEEYKRRFMGDSLFGQSYFFREFLETQFYGTGHLFPMLGIRAGFVLLWVAVNSSEKHVINFNPLLAGIEQERYEHRINIIRESLLRIPIEGLHPKFFEEVKATLAEGRPAFIFDSGIRLISDAETRVLSISFVAVDEAIQRIEVLITKFEAQGMSGISLRNLMEMERLYSELKSFHSYLQQVGCNLESDILGRSGGLEVRDTEISRIEHRLKTVLERQVFIPEEIYDTVSVLVKHCPEILRIILPGYHAYWNIIESRSARPRLTIGRYLIRCLGKFQALIIKDRNAFQDGNTFYQLAKQEFGPLAEEGIGASHAQMDILEYLVESIKQRPLLYQSLTLAVLFQDIGKTKQYYLPIPEVETLWTNSERSALVLERAEVLKRFNLEPQMERLVISLISHYGLCGHVIQGEEPLTAFEAYTAGRDECLTDAFILHSILAASAVQEGLMISDLLDLFLSYRTLAVELIKENTTWPVRLREHFREKGEDILADFKLISSRDQVLITDSHYFGIVDDDIDDEALWQGRQAAALERLFKLMGIPWVDYQDVQKFLLKIPVSFIYHKKKLKSVGASSFERDISAAQKLLGIIAVLTPEVRYYLFYSLDHLGGAMRIYDFHALSKFLGLEESLKLLLIVLQVFHHKFGIEARGGLISFRPLSESVESRGQVLQNLLRKIPFPERCFEDGPTLLSPEEYGGLHFEAHPEKQAIRVDYQDGIQYYLMAQSIATIWTHEELSKHYQKLLLDLQQKLPYNTKIFEEELEEEFKEQKRKINDRIILDFQERLGSIAGFMDLQKLHNEIQSITSKVDLSQEQNALLGEVFELHRSRIRDNYLDSIYQKINALEPEKLASYWNELKYELYSFRSFVGKEYESLMAQFMDRKLDQLGGSLNSRINSD
ncbi:MAG: hypothetical protein AB2L11_08665 [Syntrophobacteraceae bacterium]